MMVLVVRYLLDLRNGSRQREEVSSSVFIQRAISSYSSFDFDDLHTGWVLVNFILIFHALQCAYSSPLMTRSQVMTRTHLSIHDGYVSDHDINCEDRANTHLSSEYGWGARTHSLKPRR